MHAPLSTHDEVVQNLLQRLALVKESCFEIRPGSKHPLPPFVSRSKVTELLTSGVVNSVLRAKCRTPLPVTVPSVLEFCPRGLCILLEIGYGQYIPFFAQRPELRDDKLPLLSRPPRFPVDNDIWEKFSERQWEYFPVTVNSTQSYYERTHVMPFLTKEYLVGGSTAKLYKVTLASEYDALYRGEEPAVDTGQHRQFALKTYKGQNAPFYFNNEVENFARLNEDQNGFPPGLLGLHTSFLHGDTYNVLFELANGGNLEDMVLKSEPPVTGKQIFEFWKALLEVLNALERIHEIEEDPHDGGRKVFQGLHQDVKLKNILVFLDEPASTPPDSPPSGPPEYSFKLADLGISHFVRSTHGSQDVFAEDKMGTETYGAPETFRETESDQRSRIMITRSIDVWSLGCVLLTVAVWIAFGSKGVRDFQEARLAENRSTGSRAADSFHDGRRPSPEILNVVRQQLSTINMELKKSDQTTPEILHHLVVRMMNVDPKRRPTAANACADATRALEAAEWNLDKYYGTTDQYPSPGPPLSPIRPHALPLRYPVVPPGPSAFRYNWGEAQTPITTSSQQSPIQRNASARRGYSGAWTSERLALDTRRAPETPTLDRRRPPPGPRNSVPAMNATLSSPNPTHTIPYTENIAPEEPAEDEVDNAMVEFPEPRPGHVARHSDPAIPLELLNQSPSQAAPFASLPRLIPYLSVDDATKYVDDASKLWKFPKLANAHYRDFIKGRDHVFLIDDSSSMKDHESEAIFVSKVLLFFASEADRDGVDIYCTNSDRRLHEKSLRILMDFVKSRTANAIGSAEIKVHLSSILSKYKSELELKEGRGVTKMSVYVLTDGVGTALSDVEDSIRETVRTLRRFNKGKSQLGIQFISFGDDTQAMARLERLDKLGKEPDVGLDIVDTTDHRGNVWKMLLGAFDPTFDEDSSLAPPSRSSTVPVHR